MELFIVGCLIIVGGFSALLLLSTIFIGKPIFIHLQVLTGSLKYSKEIDDKIDLELGKVDAGFYHVVVGEHTIALYSKEKYPDFKETQRYSCVPELEIWISNKFYSYGNIQRMNGNSSYDVANKRPSVKLIKQIYELEKSKNTSINKKIKHNKSKAKKIVLG